MNIKRQDQKDNYVYGTLNFNMVAPTQTRSMLEKCPNSETVQIIKSKILRCFYK